MGHAEHEEPFLAAKTAHAMSYFSLYKGFECDFIDEHSLDMPKQLFSHGFQASKMPNRHL